MRDMVVTVHLHTILQRETSDGLQRKLDVTMLSGSTVADLMEDLGVSLPVAAMLLLVNGRIAQPTQTLAENDQVHLMPALSGG